MRRIYGGFLCALCATLSAGCGLLLDFDPPDQVMGMDGSVDGDAAFFDGGLEDGSFEDAQIDGAAEAGPIDAEIFDAALDGMAADSGISDDAGAGGCESDTDWCFEFRPSDPTRALIDWNSEFQWTRPDGTVGSTGWNTFSCSGGVREISPGLWHCHYIPPTITEPMSGRPLMYLYPVYRDGSSACTTTGCPGYFPAYRMWSAGVEIPTDPGFGRVTLERRPDTPHGMLIVLRLVL